MRIQIRKLGPLPPLTMGRTRLPFPAAPNLRTAQLTAGKLFDGIAAFPPERWRDLQHFRPQVLVGPAAELRALAHHMGRCGIDFESVDHAVFVVTKYGHMPASDALRSMLWHTFGVPVYEVYVGTDGSLLAAECEAHDGWHVEGRNRFSSHEGQLILHAHSDLVLPTGIAGEVTSEKCACGRPGTRLTNLRELLPFRHETRLLAATA